ncbi:hypothetical protein EGW08_010077, partial [Elysia chlorotica]
RATESKYCKTPPGNQRCSIEDYNPCSLPGFELYLKHNHQVCLMTVWNEYETLQAARGFCLHKGSALSTILNEGHQETIRENAYIADFTWIDLQYSATARDFRWSQYPGMRLTYHKFKNGTIPKNGSAGKCVKLEYFTGLWFTANCDEKHMFTCESYKYHSRHERPTMKTEKDSLGRDIVLVGDALKAACSGIVDETGAVYWEYSLGFQKIRIGVLDDDTRVQTSYEYIQQGTSCHRAIKSCLTVHIAENRSDYNLLKSLTCVVHKKGGPFPKCGGVGDRSCSFESVITTEYSNREPWLHATYHDETRRQFHAGHVAVFQCDSCVGVRGNVTLEIKSEARWVRNECGQQDASLSYTDKIVPCGMNVTAILEFPIDPRAANCAVRCTSFRIDPTGSPFNELVSDWLNISMAYGPRTPILVLSFDGVNGVVHLGSNITAECTACVGDIGSIMWKIIDNNDNALSEATLQDLNVYVERNFSLRQIECGFASVSQLTLIVTQAMHKARIVCQSSNETFIPGYDVTAVSKKFYVHGASGSQRRNAPTRGVDRGRGTATNALSVAQKPGQDSSERHVQLVVEDGRGNRQNEPNRWRFMRRSSVPMQNQKRKQRTMKQQKKNRRASLHSGKPWEALAMKFMFRKAKQQNAERLAKASTVSSWHERLMQRLKGSKATLQNDPSVSSKKTDSDYSSVDTFDEEV